MSESRAVPGCGPECELDRLLNDPEIPMQPWRVWALAEQVAAEARSK